MDPLSSSQSSLLALQSLSVQALKQSMDAAEMALSVIAPASGSSSSQTSASMPSPDGLGTLIDVRA